MNEQQIKQELNDIRKARGAVILAAIRAGKPVPPNSDRELELAVMLQNIEAARVQAKIKEARVQHITHTDQIEFGNDDVVEVFMWGRKWLAEVGPGDEVCLTAI